MRRRVSPGRRGAAQAAALRAGALAHPSEMAETPAPSGKEEAEAMPMQERDVVFALDIGTRSIVGVLGREEGGRLRVLDIEKEEHGRRAMLDGQIEDIAQVASIARIVIERLESRQHIKLQRVCVAAAGRALRSARASFTLEFAEPRQATDETVNQLEAGAVSAAESTISGGEGGFYMVGYTPSQYRLDGYPLSTLHGHRGRVMEVDVVATFLPREVVDSLYAVVGRLGLEVSSLTLEPIASLNAAIPLDIRLLNLVLVDIGAGTSDIAVCRNGSVAGYTMATVAGDEVTELLMRELLIDFRTGEALKMDIGGADPLRYTDILGIVHECGSKQLIELIEPAVQVLAGEIAEKVLDLNGGIPSAVFLAGGGSKLYGLRAAVAAALGMDDARVAIAGNHFEKNAFSDAYALEDPEYSTPLGIAISAALGMIHDSYVVTLNGAPAKLFRSGTLTVRDVLLMNGSSYSDLMGRTGANLSFLLNGARQFIRGMPGTPPVIRVNGEGAELSTVIHAGDNILFQPARAGRNGARTLAEVLGKGFSGGVTVNGEPKPLNYVVCTGDVVETNANGRIVPAAADVKPEPEPEKKPDPEKALPVRAHATVHTDGEPLEIDVPIQRRTETASSARKAGRRLAFEEPALELPLRETTAPEMQKASAEKTPRAVSARRGRTAKARQDAVPAAEEPREAVSAHQTLAAETLTTAEPLVAASMPQPVEEKSTETLEPQRAAFVFSDLQSEEIADAAPSARRAFGGPEQDAEAETTHPIPAAAEEGSPEGQAPLAPPRVGAARRAGDAEAETAHQAPAAAEEGSPEGQAPLALPRAGAARRAGEVQQPAGVTAAAAHDQNAPKRHGIPRVVLPDLPQFTALKTQAAARPLTIRLNGLPLSLESKPSGEPYYFMDLLQHSGLDFNHLVRPVELLLNGAPCDFTRTLAENDDAVIRYQDAAEENKQ